MIFFPLSKQIIYIFFTLHNHSCFRYFKIMHHLNFTKVLHPGFKWINWGKSEAIFLRGWAERTSPDLPLCLASTLQILKHSPFFWSEKSMPSSKCTIREYSMLLTKTHCPETSVLWSCTEERKSSILRAQRHNFKEVALWLGRIFMQGMFRSWSKVYWNFTLA